MGRKRDLPPTVRGRCCEVPSQETRRAVVSVYVQRRLGLRGGYSPRLLESVVLEPGEKEHMLQDMSNFGDRSGGTSVLGVPYHRGYLLYGPPGTGKTSLVSALAAHFGLSIYIINLADFNDRSLMSAVNKVPANSVLLFEDIDCMKGRQSRIESDAGSAQTDGATLSTRRECSQTRTASRSPDC